jgi:hypothetical protein
MWGVNDSGRGDVPSGVENVKHWVFLSMVVDVQISVRYVPYTVNKIAQDTLARLCISSNNMFKCLGSAERSMATLKKQQYRLSLFFAVVRLPSSILGVRSLSSPCLSK